MLRSTALRVFSLICATCMAQAQLYNTVIETAYGGVQGIPAFNSSPAGNISNWEDITVWKGIPFAASTTGANRFRPPQPRQAWGDVLDASAFGAVCPGDSNLDAGLYYGEDCLNLNIWTSGNDTNAKLPVIIWSYPAESTAAQPLFDGGGMASKGIVYVNYNYRTGSLGWLATPELSEEMYEAYGTNSSGNWGVLDQFAALKWVHANIAAFGGDPDHITVMGQSAGSAATQHMLNSPLTKGLIVNAIIESGVRDPHDPLVPTLAEGYVNQTSAYSTSESYMASLNATTLDALRALPYTDLIVSFRGTYSFGAVLDYYALPDTYENILLHGAANDVPILTGNTKDESGANYGVVTNVSAYEADLVTQYGTYWAAQFLALYPANNTNQSSGAANAHYTDTSKVGTWLWANLWKTAATAPVYNYFWDHAPPNQTRGAYHESEINYVLNNLYDTPSTPWTADDYEIAAIMNAYWVNFAKTGDPNKADAFTSDVSLVYFPTQDESEQVVFRVGDGFNNIPLASPEQVALIEAYFASQPAY